jgi:hypothetical protein
LHARFEMKEAGNAATPLLQFCSFHRGQVVSQLLWPRSHEELDCFVAAKEAALENADVLLTAAVTTSRAIARYFLIISNPFRSYESVLRKPRVTVLNTDAGASETRNKKRQLTAPVLPVRKR